jgi:two-component system response regulator NreC
MTKIRVLLAEDHKVMLEGLRMVVNSQPDMEVVGEADNGREAVALTQKLRPDLLVMDLSMPELNGLKATETLKKLRPDIRILIFTRHTDSSHVQQLLRSGASGYVLKQSAADELLDAIRRVAAGQGYLDPAITEHIFGSVSGARGSPAGKDLSEREEDVLRFVAQGLLSREIAVRLHISVKTVDTHKARAMTKMGLANRVDIVRYALLQGWLNDM